MPKQLTVPGGWRTISAVGLCCFRILPTLRPSAQPSLLRLPKPIRSFRNSIVNCWGCRLTARFRIWRGSATSKKNLACTIPFPIIEDLSMTVAHAYGMIMPGASDTSAVRTTFLIDPGRCSAAMVYYPMSNGRSIAEFLRLLKAMQTSDQHQVATPEGWQPGDKVIVPPPATVEAANARLQEGYECVDWYFCKKELAADAANPTD